MIGERAARLCEARFGFSGREWIRVDIFGSDPQSVEGPRPEFPMRARPSRRASPYGSGSIVHIPDVLTDPEYPRQRVAEQTGFRGALGVPMMREGQIVGVITVARAEAGLFSDKQVELLKTFADQAVIAIENVRLFNETKEALERQTATAEILKVISSSPTDVQPVFDAIVRNAVTLCDAMFAAVRLRRRAAAFSRHDQPDEKFCEASRSVSLEPDRSQISGRTILSKSVPRMEDALADPRVQHVGRSERGRAGAMLGVPLLREGNPIGAIVVGWEQPGPIAPGRSSC